MVDAISIALTGLMAQGTRLAVSASNIANANTIGALPTLAAPVSTVYKPLSVSFTALGAGVNNGAGVVANVTEDVAGFTPEFNPSSPFADAAGLVAAPAVDIAQQIVNALEAKLLYKAGVGVIKTQKEMNDDLLNIL
jgi:flagellar basal-body rod protein FlgC